MLVFFRRSGPGVHGTPLFILAKDRRCNAFVGNMRGHGTVHVKSLYDSRLPF
jgi:hypothetical protein